MLAKDKKSKKGKSRKGKNQKSSEYNQIVDQGNSSFPELKNVKKFLTKT